MTPEQAAALYNGLIVFAGGLLVWLGTMLSRKAKDKPAAAGTRMEIAGAVIDGKDAKMLADSFDRAAANMTSLQLELVEHRKALDRNSGVAEDVRDATTEVRGEMRNLANSLLLTRK